jgi:hypothetical protein
MTATNKNIRVAILFLLAMCLLPACDTADDNNPSPVPDARDKFTGTWQVNDENCGKGKYVVSIAKDQSNSAQVLISNFAFSNTSQPDTAIIAGSSIVVFKQKNSEGWSIEGSGFYKSNGSIEWTYTLIISGFQESCTATYVRGK